MWVQVPPSAPNIQIKSVMQFQIKNTLDQKLKKDYEIVAPKDLVEKKINDRIDQIKGFRKGAVPANVVKEKYGQSILAEESEKLINEALQKIVKDNNFKVAMTP